MKEDHSFPDFLKKILLPGHPTYALFLNQPLRKHEELN